MGGAAPSLTPASAFSVSHRLESGTEADGMEFCRDSYKVLPL